MNRQLLSCTLLVCAFAAHLSGSAITNVVITGLFHNPTDDTPGVQVGDPVVSPATAGPVTNVSWGVPPTGADPQSSYRFAAINQPALPNIPGPIAVNPPPVTPYFTLGTFTHNNFVVDNPYLTSVLLDVTLSFDVDGVPTGPLTFTYMFQHTETPNQIETGAPICPFATPIGAECTDRVVLSPNGVPPSFNVGGVSFTLDLAFQGSGGTPVSEFITNERESNEIFLVGRFSGSSDVPEPATVATMGAGLLSIAALRFRRPRT